MVKLCLGTANIGSRYGINQTKLNKNEAIKILNQAIKNNIVNLDTSFEYKSSHTQLKKILNPKIKVNTKIVLSKKTNFELIKNKIINFNKNSPAKIYSLLLHEQNDALVKKKIELIKKLKAQGLVNKIGVSVYDLTVLKKILKLWVPDIIQIPVNPFNLEFISNKFLKKIRKKKILIFARSIFLQGILTRKKYILKKNKKDLEDWFKFCEFNSIDPVKLCIDFCKSIKEIDYLVIGVQNSEELMQINKYFKMPIKLESNLIIKKNYKKIDLRKI